MEWSTDKKKFYHTDNPTRFIKDYEFDESTGEILFTGRQVRVDGFIIGGDNCLYIGCWERCYTDENAGFTILIQSEARGRKAFLFGGNSYK